MPCHHRFVPSEAMRHHNPRFFGGSELVFNSVDPFRSDRGPPWHYAFHGHCQFHDDFSRLQHEMRMSLNKRLNVTVFRMIEIVPVERLGNPRTKWSFLAGELSIAMSYYCNWYDEF